MEPNPVTAGGLEVQSENVRDNTHGLYRGWWYAPRPLLLKRELGLSGPWNRHIGTNPKTLKGPLTGMSATPWGSGVAPPPSGEG